MKPRFLLPLFAAAITATTLQAQVTLTFDTDLQGFTKNDATTLEWSNVNGGSMAIKGNGGWTGNGTQFSMQENPAFFDEMRLAETNGGTLTFDIIVRGSEIVMPANPPGWFQVVVIANTGGGWDQTIKDFGLGAGQWPLNPDERVFKISLPVIQGSADGNDGNVTLNTSAGWGNLHFGINTQSNDGTGTAGVSTAPNSAAIYIDNVTIKANEVALPPPTMDIQPVIHGLNVISTGNGQYDRRMIRTKDSEAPYTWVGVATPANPVKYSFTVSNLPQAGGYPSFIYLIPFGDLDPFPDFSDPDYQAPTCIRLNFIRSNANQPGGWGDLSYKVNLANSNGPAGNEFWVTDTVPSSGLGGTLATVGSANVLGTWSVTFTSDTDFTITSPDGTASSGALLPETAALFAGPLHVFFGNLPAAEANKGLSAVYSQASITGVPFPAVDNFELPLAEGDEFFQVAPANRTGVVVPKDTASHWLTWSLPATGFLLYQTPDLTDPEQWVPMEITGTFSSGGRTVYYLLDSTETTDVNRNFFRLVKPAPPTGD